MSAEADAALYRALCLFAEGGDLADAARLAGMTPAELEAYIRDEHARLG